MRRIVSSRWLLAIATIAIALATLTPADQMGSTSGPLCIVCGEVGGVDAVLNVLLFVPYGMALGLMGVPWRRAILVVVASTVAIETLQFSAIAGRDSSLGDVLTNSLGGALGYWLGVNFERIVRPEARFARALAIAWAALFLAFQALGSYAHLPAMTSVPYSGQIARDLGEGLRPFPGDVLAPRIGMDTIKDFGFAPARLRATLADGAPTRATVVPKSCSRGLSDIIHIADAHQREIMILAQRDADLVYGVRTSAQRLRLRALRYALPRVFGRVHCQLNDDTIAVSAQILHREVILAATHRDGTRQVMQIEPDVAATWRLFAPWQPYVSGKWTGRAVTALWLAAWIAPFGYWTLFATARSNGGMSGFAVAVLVSVALWAIPVSFGLPAASLLDWIGAGLGGFGAWIAHALQRQESPA